MPSPSDYHLLIAEDNDVSREMMTRILEAKGYRVSGARDGGEAIEMIGKNQYDLALVDINMAPQGGFEFARHLLVKSIDLPIVIITSDESSDMLVKANDLGVKRVLQKPVLPERLIHTVERIFESRQARSPSIATTSHAVLHDPKGLMLRAIELAVENALSGKGRAFGAVVADKDGRIIGEGVNGLTSRVDPIAHAEVMAIRQAAENLGRVDLTGCSLYSSCEPTMIGKALILSVGLSSVYYALSHNDINGLKNREGKIKADLIRDLPEAVSYQQLCYEEACNAFSIVPNEASL